MASDKILIAVVSDLHINSTVALCPPSIERDDGDTWHPSKAQRWINRQWATFWERVKARPPGWDLCVVAMGELANSEEKYRSYQIIARNRATLLMACATVLEPVRRLTDEFYVVRATEAHAGLSSELEEVIARDLDAVPDGSRASWDHLPYEAAGVRIDFQHHPPSVSLRPWTRGAAAARCGEIVESRYTKRGEVAPNSSVWGHVHYWADGGTTGRTRGLICPSWSLTTTHGHRLGYSGALEDIGGVLLWCEGGRLVVDPLLFSPPRKKVQKWKK